MNPENNKEAPVESPEVLHIRKPTVSLQCSDGLYEEYSDDEEDQKPKEEENQSFPWRAARSVINALNYAGEALGEFFEITTPKYSYEIEQFKKEQEERAKEEAIEKENTWDVEKSGNDEKSVTEVPSRSVEKF